jgi:class 3 adenylate cyclase
VSEPAPPASAIASEDRRLNLGTAATATQLTATESGLPLAKLSDFGLARTALPTESLALTQDGAILGTPLYMSPEQCRGESADSRSDVYSIGATWFHLLTGRPPFTGANHIEVMNHHCQSPLPSLKQLCPELSDGVIAAVEKCLAKNADARYADASGLRDDLDRMLLGEAASMVLHPAAPSAGPEVLQFQLECELRSSPARLWPYVSHTDRVNHALGLPAVRYTTRRDPARGVERFAEARLAGQTLRWQEHPYEWIEGRRLSVLREFSTGPFLWFMNVVELLPASGGGTRLTQRFRVVPRNWLGRLIARLELGRRSPRNFGRLYRQLDGYLQSHSSAPAEVDAFGVNHVMTASGRSRLRERLDRLSEAQVDPSAVETLRQYLEHASDLDVARIRPLVFAERFGLVPQNVVTLFLLAAREGVLTLLWDILCPSCRIPADVQETLASLKDHAYCPSCDLKYEVDFANSVEMIFRVHPEIRSTETRTYCIGGPAFSAHVVAQVRLAEGERFDLELSFTEGAYRLRGAALPFAVELRVASSGTASRLDLSLRRPPLPGMVPVLRPGAQVITLHNDTASPLQIRVERTAGRSQAVTAAAAAAIPLFRQMFPKEVLAPGQIVSVTSTTLLLAELCGTRALYETLGDGRAFELIRGRLQQLDDQVRAAGGAVVKFVGDGLLANFSDSTAAFQCAVAMLNTLPAGSEAPAVRLALHRGPALVTTINDRLDYFGETIHTARQLLDAAPAGAMLWAASSASCDAVLELAGGIPLQIEPAGFVVPQLMRFVLLGRIAQNTE